MENGAEVMDQPKNSSPTGVAPGEGCPRPKGRKRRIAKGALFLAVLLGSLIAVYFSPLRPMLAEPSRLGSSLRAPLASLGFWQYPVFLVGTAMLVAVGVPRLALCVLGGILFHFWGGILLTYLGSLLGYYGAFLFVRWGGRDLVLHRWPKLSKWANAIHDHGVMGVVLLRSLPLHGTFINLCLGLSHLRHRHFLLGTAIGILPESIPATLIGAGLVKASLKQSAGQITLAVLVFAAIWIACGIVMRKLKNSKEGSQIMDEMSTLSDDDPQ